MSSLLLPPGFRFHKDEIREVAQAHGLDPALVAAVVWQESAFNTDGFRHEREFWNRYMKTTPMYAGLNPRRYSSSYGLMQCMWVVAVERGFDPKLPPESLFVPLIGLTYGCKQLAMLLEWSKQQGAGPLMVEAALASYNGGRGGNRQSDKPLRNGKYAREVLSRLSVMRREYASA